MDVNGIFSKEGAQFYLGSLVSALEHLHSPRVCTVFRDLKPENVMLDQRGYVRLIDFGLARRLETPFSPRFTLVGTPEFLSPEVLTGGGYTTCADIWGLGVMAYELLVGQLPFQR